MPDKDEINAVRFDALLYGLELAYLTGKKYTKARTDLKKRVSAVAGIANIPEIQAKAELITTILDTDYLEEAGINEFEHIREELRNLMKYIPKGRESYITNFDDDILSIEWKDAELDNDELKNEINDLLYHVMVLAANQGLEWSDVEKVLDERNEKIGNLKKFHQVDKNT